MNQGTSKATETLEIIYKTPILRGFLILLVPLTLYLGIRDIYYGATGAVLFFSLQAAILGAAWALHLRNNYKGASHFTVFGVALVQLLDIALMGYQDIHSFYLVSVVCSLLLLGGSFLLDALGPLLFHSGALWGYYGVFIFLNLEKASGFSGQLPLEAQLAVPSIGFAASTLIALGSRNVFDHVIRKQESLLQESADHQKNLAQLIRGIAHRLNTPLGNAKMLLSAPVPVEGEHRTLLTDAIQESTELITRLKTFLACSETEIVSISSFSAHLNVLMGQMSPPGQLNISPGAETWFQEPWPYPWEVLHLVLEEVLDNAVLHGSKDHPVDVNFSGTLEGTRIINIRNRAPDLRPMDLRKFTLPFFSTLNQSDHPGLGLYFADYLVGKKLKGTLRLEISGPEHLQVTITLPGRPKKN